MDGFFSASRVSVNSCESELCDWSGLPAHLLSDIADNITDVNDYVSFGRVCTSWQTVFLHDIKIILGSPLLLIDPPDDNDFYKWRDVYSLSKKSICNFKLPLPHSKHCRGSSFGWLITMEEKGEDNYHVQLQNPFLGRTLNLPTLDNIVQLNPYEFGGVQYLWKATISSDPSVSDDFIVMAIVSRCNGLAYFKAGNKCWMPIGDHWSMNSEKSVEDVIFYHKTKQFYALRLCGTLLATEVCGDEQEPKLIQVAPPMDSPLFFGSANKCLVEDLVSGDLLQVCRRHHYSEYDQTGKCHIIPEFLVFKLNPLEQSWMQIHDLGGKVLFLGPTCSVLRAASDCPGCVPNCIYFNSEPYMAGYDPTIFYKPVTEGMYHMEDGTIQEYYSKRTYDKPVPPTIWLEPTLPLNSLEA